MAHAIDAIHEDDLTRARDNAEGILSEIYSGPTLFAALCRESEKRLKGEQPAASIDVTATVWIAKVKKLWALFPVGGQDALLRMIERGNFGRDTASAVLGRDGSSHVYVSMHEAVEQCGLALVAAATWPGIDNIKESLNSAEHVRNWSERMAGLPTLSVDQGQARVALSIEWRNACEWLSKQPAQAGVTPPAVDDDGSLDERAVLLKYKHKDWSNRQIADALGCNEKSLYKPHMTAFKAARKALKEGREDYRDDLSKDRRIVTGPDRRHKPSTINKHDRDE